MKKMRFSYKEDYIYLDDEIFCDFTPCNVTNILNKLCMDKEELKIQLFESERDYLLETMDISDKCYVAEELEELRKRIFGDVI